MILNLTEDRRINSDSQQYSLEKKRVVKGVPTWLSYRYYGSLGAAMRSAPEQLLRESEAEGVQEVLLFLRTLERKLLVMLGEKPLGN